jgi:cytochrome c-type biogenesis protein CcmH
MNPGRALILALALMLTAPAAHAVNPSEMLPDPKLESRARDISQGLRCLVCQNQSIDDSDAELARDLRVIVRERIKAGDSNEQVERFVVDRYGDYVLLKPPFKASTYLLWFGPLGLLLIAIAVAVNFYRRRGIAADAIAAPAKLSADEERKLKKLLGDAPSP